MILNLLNSTILFWVLGFIFGQIEYIIFAQYNKTKWYKAFCYGIINLLVMCLGAKLLYILENIDDVVENGIEFNGFSLYGAIFIQPLSALIISKIFKKKYLEIADFIIIPFLTMLAFYRLDCYRNGCCGGIEINYYIVPTQLIEFSFCLILAGIFTILSYKNKMKSGYMFAYVFVIYGIFRFIIEFFRDRDNLFFYFSISHILSLISIIIGVIILLIIKKCVVKENEENYKSDI